METLRKGHPQLTEESLLSAEAVNAARLEYVRNLLETQVGDLTKLDEEVVESLHKHEVLSERPLCYFCPFDRAYYETRIASLGAIAVAEAFGDRDTIEVTCEFTRQTYTFDRSVFEALDA